QVSFVLRAVAQYACLLLVAAGLAGCADGRSHNLLDVTAAAQADILATHRILVATTRGKAKDPAALFDGSRGTLSFARVDVTIPRIHQPGMLEQPPGGGRRDAAKHFAADEVAVFRDKDGFEGALRQRLAKTAGRALVFIHGYRT